MQLIGHGVGLSSLSPPERAHSWLIETEGLRRDYCVGGVLIRALDGISLTIGHGEFVAVMGPSGSGKSTLLNLLGCLDTPTAGRYWLDGRDVSLLDRDQRALIRNSHIGFIFQSLNLLPRTTALENVEAPLQYARVPAAERRRRAEERLRAVELLDRAQHYPSQLSGGQQQRVAIARALANNPSLVLADEPSGALDTQTSRDIMRILQRLNREEGVTLVLVTHEPDVAAYASRLVTFRDGRVITDERLPADPMPQETSGGEIARCWP
jgi:putative ABC transport system ATP-binding protein